MATDASVTNPGMTDASVRNTSIMVIESEQSVPRDKGMLPMTETNEAVAEALSVIDKALAQMLRRELVTSGEVTDVLLDVRSLLTLPAHADR